MSSSPDRRSCNCSASLAVSSSMLVSLSTVCGTPMSSLVLNTNSLAVEISNAQQNPYIDVLNVPMEAADANVNADMASFLWENGGGL